MKANLYKGSLETIIIQLLSSEAMYGYQITKKVKLISDGEIVIKEGSLYPLLHKMEAKGLIESYTENIGNRERKYYRLSKTGIEEKAAIIGEMNAYLNLMQNILNPKIA